MKRVHKNSIVLLLLLLVGLSGAIFLGRQLQFGSDQIINSYLELSRTSRGKEDLAVIKKILAETVESRALVAGAFLESQALISFIEQLEGLAKKTGVELKLDEPRLGASKIPSLEISFQATGPFANLSHLLSLLENLPYRLEWRGVAWALDSGTTWSGNFSLAVMSYNKSNAIK